MCRFRTDFKTEGLPQHLILNFKVIDEHGRQLALGRNLAQLRAELGEEAQATFRNVAQQDAAVAKDLGGEVTNWTFGELPELMEIQRRGETLIGHWWMWERPAASKYSTIRSKHRKHIAKDSEGSSVSPCVSR